MARSPRNLLFATTILAGGIVALPAFAGNISGTVSDVTSSQPLGGAQVEIVELGRTAQTGSDGSFRFADIPAGQYTLRTTYAGANPSDSSITVSETGTVTTSLTFGSDLEEFLVVGQRAMLASSISRQRAADGVSSIVTRDAIGQFPDQNVAEAARRMPGINVLNDQGEGRFIAVRGLDPSLNAASINGTRLPAPESDTRQVALDVIASELVESIEVKKTLTPDMDADTIGASIEINTTKAFDRAEPFFSVTAEGSYNNLNEKVSPKVGVDFSYPFNDRVGIAGGFSYNKRKTSTDNVESEGWDETDGGVVFADTVEYRDYDVERTRWGGSLSLDFRASDTTTLYARGLYSQFDDFEQRGRLIFEFDEEPASGTDTTANFLSDDGEIAVIRDLKDRFEGQTIQSYEIGGETFADAWEVKYSASHSKADEHEFKTQDQTEFAWKTEEPGELGVTFDYSDMYLPAFSITAGADAFADASTYEFDKVTNVDGLAEDEEWAFKLDVGHTFALDQGELKLQFGSKARLRSKSFDGTEVTEEFDGDYTLADVVGEHSYGLLDIMPMPGLSQVRAFYDANESSFEVEEFDTEFDSTVEDFSVNEDIVAGYGLARWETSRLVAIGGVRVEFTKDDVRGNLTEVIEEGGTYNGEVLDEDILLVDPVVFTDNYTDILPSVSLRYEAADDVILRAGAFKSVVRPGFSKMAPIFAIEENDEGDREGEFGNPDLEPFRAWNFDVSAEYYFAPNAVVQVGAFYKTIKNYIVDQEFEDITFNGIFANEAIIPVNGDKAEVKGVEFNYQHALSNLPAPLDGFIVGLNYTYTDAEGTLADGRVIPLPAASEHNLNASLGWEKGPISLRATAAYRDGYLDEVSDDPQEDRYVKSHLQWDFSAKYRVTENVRVYAELVNISDEPYVAYQQGPGGDRLLQYEEYSWTGKFGVKASF